MTTPKEKIDWTKVDTDVTVRDLVRKWNGEPSAIGINTAPLSPQEWSDLSAAFVSHVNSEHAEGRYGITATRQQLDSGLDVIRLRDPDPYATILGGYGTLGIDDFPSWASYEDTREALTKMSAMLEPTEYVQLNGTFDADSSTPSIAQRLVEDGLAQAELDSIVVPTRADLTASCCAIVDGKRRRIVRSEIRQSVDAGCWANTSIGPPSLSDDEFRRLWDSWVADWDALCVDVEGITHSTWYMRACARMVCEALDPRRVLTTRVWKNDVLVFVSLTSLTRPGWATFSHVISDRKAAGDVRATYLAIESVWSLCQQLGLSYLDFSGVDYEASDAEKARMAYKAHYRSATLKSTPTAVSLCFSNPSIIHPMKGVHGFANGKLVRTVAEAWWLNEDGEWDDEEEEEEEDGEEYEDVDEEEAEEEE